MTLKIEPGEANPSKILSKSSLSRLEVPPVTFGLPGGGPLPKCTENEVSFQRNSVTFRLSIHSIFYSTNQNNKKMRAFRLVFQTFFRVRNQAEYNTHSPAAKPLPALPQV